ncbi:FAD/NAD(P)-binding protein [Algoriphagus halophytocola]|uniref:FAD/NAD(P)-binding protein n=1 Tax=Algoriphagus halophytocola TaxID=2991499 RepID=A0ABY6MIF4_9BACT|nr:MULTISPECIES: FAD/NAD(P)-binding protein [unclassified Algoriphagus]UZD23573.1 FAD/NAD(P)-binding protein [Algoriphagus sp. TR-M5]WBL44867.1 FAD/NAD(P)-binding protein [Algoriphagus sp. TR-M9]
MKERESFKIAIIGSGPKGLYGLERALAHLNCIERKLPIEIHLFNKTDSFGAGDIYRTDQPEYLLMNYSNGYINMWTEQEPKSIVSRTTGYSDWLKIKFDHCSSCKTSDFSPRALVGRYLKDGFRRLVDAAPSNCEIYCHEGEVFDLKEEQGDFRIHWKGKAGSDQFLSGISTVLIASGHPNQNSDQYVSKLGYVDFIYPVSSKLNKVQSNKKVIIKGMGLTFIDACLALSEGKGGQFEQAENGMLNYIPSGNEPETIFPFSKSGLPMIPRGNTYGLPEPKLYFFNEEHIHMAIANAEKIDFDHELLPLISLEFKAAYYRALFHSYSLDFSEWGDVAKLEVVIDEFHERYPEECRFEFEQFLRELPSSDLSRDAHLQQLIAQYIAAAETGPESNPIAAVSAVWRSMCELFNKLYRFGRLKPESHQLFDEKYAGHLNRISYGPPIQNMKKILALAKAGIIDFSFCKCPEIEFEPEFKLSSKDGKSTISEYFIDARIPKSCLVDSSSELYMNMMKQGLVRPYVNRMVGKLDYKPGCLDINEQGHPLDEKELPNPKLTFIGTPTEGLTYDNDTLSRNRNDFVSNWGKEVSQLYMDYSQRITHSSSKTHFHESLT